MNYIGEKLDTLLVAVDFTSYSEVAALFASRLAHKLSAQLIILHVIHDPAEAPGFYVTKDKTKKYIQTMEETANDMMAAFLEKLCTANPLEEPLAKAKSLLVIGTPAVRIVEMAQKENADMIIVGSHGRTGLSDIMIGSKAERVVKLAPIPVTVVKAPTPK
jgi:nucleotide-binding universal stress UspA family protein